MGTKLLQRGRGLLLLSAAWTGASSAFHGDHSPKKSGCKRRARSRKDAAARNGCISKGYAPIAPSAPSAHVRYRLTAPSQRESSTCARPPGADLGETTARSKAESNYAKLDEPTAASDQKIVEALGAVAADRGVSHSQVALAWLRRNRVVAGPIVGALSTKHIDDAIASLSITLTDDEAARLEAPYIPRRDNQGVSDSTMLARAAEAATGFKTAAA